MKETYMEDFDIREQPWWPPQPSGQYWWPKELSGNPKGLRKIKVEVKRKIKVEIKRKPQPT